MPLTAIHPTAGLIDATQANIGVSVGWDDIYKPKVPVGLTCRGCGDILHAKVSQRELRFFAHSRRQEHCAFTGESLDHRLLKAELAAAIRTAGWTADLEVAGTGWRADVLATSPDLSCRIAWEAQLASTTTAELAERTARMLAEVAGVVWVTDKRAPWMRQVPSVRVQRDASGTLRITDGAARFRAAWCPRRDACDHVNDFGLGSGGVPCGGHGSWERPEGVSLTDFVAFVSQGRLQPHAADVPQWRNDGDGNENLGLVWTAQSYIRAEAEQLSATRRLHAWREEQLRAREQWEANVAALLARQTAMIRPAVEYVYREVHTYPHIAEPPGDPEWAMGLPVRVGARVVAVICPVAGRITPAVSSRMLAVTVLVASEQERQRLAKACGVKQSVVSLEIDEICGSGSPSSSVSVQTIVRRLFGSS